MAAVFAIVPAATANESNNPEKWFKGYEVEYLNAYEKAHKAGFDVGANLVDDYDKPRSVVEESTERLKLWLNPPAPVEVEESVPTSTATTYSGGVGGSTVQCESGGDYSANTGNGYYGGYQFDSGTWDAYGDSSYAEASDAPPAAQDAAAASVPYDAWPNC